jgi:hypothetical protein
MATASIKTPRRRAARERARASVLVLTLTTSLVMTAARQPRADQGQAACPPVTAVDGPTGVTGRIVEILRAHEVAVGSPSGCRQSGVRAVVTGSDGGGRRYHLLVYDRYGRRSDRVVGDAAAAATVIESWAVDEDTDLLTSSPASPPQAVVVAPPPAAGPPRPDPSLRLAASFEGALGSDRSLWYGAGAAVCIHLEHVCVGTKMRALFTGNYRQTDADTDTVSRSRFDLLLTVAVPWSRGRVTVAPAAALGAGWVRTFSRDAAGQTVYDDGGGMRANLAVDVLLRVTKHLDVGGELGVTQALFSRTDAHFEDTTFFPGQPATTVHTGIACVLTP